MNEDPKTYTVRLTRMGRFTSWTGGEIESVFTSLATAFHTATQGTVRLATEWAVPIDEGTDDGLRNDHLDSGLRKVLADRLDDKGAKCICLLVGSKWYHRPESIYGIMFDADLWDAEVGAPLYDHNRIPRQGCVVFADLFKGASDRSADMLRTTLHELGHVFNLPHDSSRSSIMTQTEPGLPPEAFGRYLDKHVDFLRHLEHPNLNYYVRPGGAPFDVRGGLLDSRSGNADTPSRKHLILSIALPRERFLLGEPIALDVWLSPRTQTTKTYNLPDELDAGYDRFSAWIEFPNGDIRRYRSFNRYCALPTRCPVSTTMPLRNNINLFWGNQGFVFNEAGTYRVWCKYSFGGDSEETLTSNSIGFEIASLAHVGQREKKQSLLLYDPAVGKRLFFRNFEGAPQVESRVRHLVSEFAKEPIAAFPSYVLGRHLLCHTAAKRGAAALKEGKELLRRARESNWIGNAARMTADRLLTESAGVV